MYNSTTNRPPPYSPPHSHTGNRSKPKKPYRRTVSTPYQSTEPTETTPLVGRTKPKLNWVPWVLVASLLIATCISGHAAITSKERLNDALSPENIIRRNQVWKEEELHHQEEKDRWLKEEARLEDDYERAKAGWADKEDLLRTHYDQAKIEWSQKEASLESDYKGSKIVWARKEDVLRKHYDNATIEWSKKEASLKSDYERSQAAWSKKEDSLKQHYDQARTEWSKKETSLRTEYEKLKSNWERDHQRYRRDQERWESDRQAADEEQRKRAEERKRLGIAWDTPFGHQCASYGTRPYNAKIVNVPSYMDPVRVCAEMPIQFHGRTIEKPIWCEKLKNGEVHGHWVVDFDEVLCRPYWNTPEDKGCVGYRSGLHRYEARLWGWHQGNGPAMCASTPNTINGHYFKSPAHCEDWKGMVGLFEVPDSDCD